MQRFDIKAQNVEVKLEFLRSLDYNWSIRYNEKGCCSLCVLRAYDSFIADDVNGDRLDERLRKRYGC